MDGKKLQTDIESKLKRARPRQKT